MSALPYFFLDKKVTNLSAARQEIMAENHFREIIFSLAFHATQAVSQKCCFSVFGSLVGGLLNATARQALVISYENDFRPGLVSTKVLS